MMENPSCENLRDNKSEFPDYLSPLVSLSEDISIGSLDSCLGITSELTGLILAIYKKLKLAEKAGYSSPIEQMITVSMKKVAENIENREKYKVPYKEILRDLNIYATQLYLLYRSSMYKLTQPNLFDGIDLFRDVPQQLLADYYSIIEECDAFIKGGTSCAYFLIPDLIPSVSTKLLFSQGDPNTRLLLVSLPRKLLFIPDCLIPSLIHEMAHYSGDSLRKREERAKILYRLLAYYLLREIKYGTVGEKEEAFTAFIIEKPFLTFATYYEGEEADFGRCYFLSNVIKCMEDSLELFSDDRVIKPLYEMITKGIPEALRGGDIKDPNALKRLFSSGGITKNAIVFIRSIEDIVHEVYADITTVYLNDLSPAEYINMLYQNGCVFEQTCLIQERIRIVLGICYCPQDGGINDCCNRMEDKISNIFTADNDRRGNDNPAECPPDAQREIIEALKKWDSSQNNRKYPFGIRYYLCEYFFKVFSEMKESEQYRSARKKLVSYYKK